MAIMNLNKHVFKGHRTLLGAKYVTYGELELSTRYEIFPKSKNGFDWGNGGSSAMQLAFAIIFQVSNKEIAERLYAKFTEDVVKNLNSRDWLVSANDVLEWLEKYDEKVLTPSTQKYLYEQPPVHIKTTETIEKQLERAPVIKKSKKPQVNVVKSVCKELNITQKNLAEILEVPEGTVSSWAVKNEIPRLGKKAIEFYKISTKNQQIVDSYKNFIHLLDVS